MNPDDLDSMICKNDRDACVRFFSGMSEKERKALSERALEWLDLALAYQETAPWAGISQALFPLEQMPARIRSQLELLKKVDSGVIRIPAKIKDPNYLEQIRLAVTASAGLSELRKMPLPSPTHAFAIMKERKPKWLDRWLNLACERAPHAVFEMTRAIEQDGVATAERGEGYWLAMALSLCQKEAEFLLDEFRLNGELRNEMLWQMLESEQAVRALSDPSSINEELSRARVQRSRALTDWRQWGERLEERRRASYVWKIVLGELYRSAELSQERLMEAIFSWLTRLSADAESRASSALAGDISPAGWFQNVHDELQLSQAQKLALAPRYIGLLAVKDSSTLAFAIQNLLECPGEGLPAEDLLGNIGRVFYLKKKEPAIAALKLLEKLQKTRTDCQNACWQVICEAFAHQSADIQKRALSVLKKSKAVADPEISARLLSSSESMSGLIKKEVLEFLAESGGSLSLSSLDLQARDVDSGSVDDLLARANAINDSLAIHAGLPQALEALETGQIVHGSLELSSLEIPRLDPAGKIKPVENIDDLIFLYLHVLEASSSADDVERLLDGLLRLCHLRPSDFESQVSSLRKKLEGAYNAINRVPSSFMPFSGTSVVLDLQALAIAWLDSTLQKSEPGFLKQVLQNMGLAGSASGLPAFLEDTINRIRNRASVMSFFSVRLQSLSRLLARRTSLPLLSAPTHKGAWIDPRVLPDRIRQWESAQLKLDNADLIQCLLRLAPEHRKEALALMPQSQEESIRVIRYALGDQMKTPVNTPELWVAAFRCREPKGQSKYLQERFPELGPDSATCASYREAIDAFKKRPDRVFVSSWRGETELVPIESIPPYAFRPAVKYFPTELLHDPKSFWEPTELSEFYYLLDRESYFAFQTRRVAVFIESQGNYWQGSWDPLFDPDQRLSGMGSWLLVFGLSAKQNELSRLAIDGLVQGVEDGRIDGVEFGATMAKALGSEKLTLGRMISAFKDISRISPLHLHFVLRTMETCLAELPAELASKPPIPLIELLFELCHSSSLAIDNDGCRKFLTQIQGKGKAAKLAKLLLELPPGMDAKHRKRVAVQILEARVKRAERWRSWLAQSSVQANQRASTTTLN